MEFPEILKYVCRFCRSYDLALDWNDELDEFISISYKDCYYKYTNIKKIDGDTLSQYLCQGCAMGVKDFHLIVENSLETRRLWMRNQESLRSPSHTATESVQRNSTMSAIIKTGYDSVLMDSLDENAHGVPDSESSVKQCKIGRPKVSDGEIGADFNDLISPIEYSVDVFEEYEESLHESQTVDDIKEDGEICFEMVETIEEGLDQICEETNNGAEICQDDEYMSVERIAEEILCDEFDEENSPGVESAYDSQTDSIPNNIELKTEEDKQDSDNPNTLTNSENKPRSIGNTPVMCSYCSKIVHNVYYLKLHEQTHQANRRREVSCPVCGLKLYNKRSLNTHMAIHEKDRVKKYKCEFCEKAFFHRGACNVHRRIHLGQMVQCPLCPKQYFRQLELDKHMQTHSHEALNSSKPKKYYVHCKYCDKKIQSIRFSAHRAAHINDPYMRCTLCEKDFFSRRSGGKHMARVHNRKGGNYDDISFFYKSKVSPRQTLVMLMQQEVVEPAE